MMDNGADGRDFQGKARRRMWQRVEPRSRVGGPFLMDELFMRPNEGDRCELNGGCGSVRLEQIIESLAKKLKRKIAVASSS